MPSLLRREQNERLDPRSVLELDLLIINGRDRYGFEVKRTSSPGITPSMRSALSDLKLKSLSVIHAGETTFQLDKNIRAIALSRLLQDIKPL